MFSLLGIGFFIFAGSAGAAEKIHFFTFDQFRDNDLSSVMGDFGPDESGACLKHHPFGSISIDIHPDSNTKRAGAIVHFSGTVHNEGEFPIVSGRVLVRLVRLGNYVMSAGPNAIEEFIARDGITLGPGETKEISFEHKLPAAVQTNRYAFYFFFDVAKKFALAGLPFSDIDPGGIALLDIEGKEGGIFFDRERVLINDAPYVPTGLSRVFSGGKALSIRVPLRNEQMNEKIVTVMYELFAWSAQDEENSLGTRRESVKLDSRSGKSLSFLIGAPSLPVYFLKITAEAPDGEKSFIGIRLVTERFKPRIIFAGVSALPLQKNIPAAMFACVGNTSATTGEGILFLTLRNRAGVIITTAERKTPIGGTIVYLGRSFRPHISIIEGATLEVKLTDEKKAVYDAVTLIFDCSKDQFLCARTSSRQKIFASFALVSFLGLASLVILRKRNNNA